MNHLKNMLTAVSIVVMSAVAMPFGAWAAEPAALDSQMLSSVSKLVPVGVQLREISINDGRLLSFKGRAKNLTRISEAMQSLAKSPSLSAVKLVQTSSIKDASGTDVMEFLITADAR